MEQLTLSHHQKINFLVIFCFFTLFLFSETLSMELFFGKPKEKNEQKKEITLFNDTENTIACAWYRKTEHGYKAIEGSCAHSDPKKKCTLPYEGSGGLTALVAMTGVTSEPFLIISKNSLDKKEITQKELDCLKEDSDTTIKDFRYSNWEGFKKGIYIVSYDNEGKQLECISQRILKLCNKTAQNIDLCWYWQQANELYKKKSAIYTVTPDKIVEIPSYTTKGASGIVSNPFFLFISLNNKNSLYGQEHTCRTVLGQCELKKYNIAIKDFRLSNWDHYETKGTYYLCLVNPLNENNKFCCSSKPTTMHIKNNAHVELYVACYKKSDLKLQHESNHNFFRIERNPLRFACWWTTLHPKEFAPVGHVIPLIENDCELFVSSRMDTLELDTVQKNLFIKKLKPATHNAQAYQTYEVDVIGNMSNPELSIIQTSDNNLNEDGKK